MKQISSAFLRYQLAAIFLVVFAAPVVVKAQIQVSLKLDRSIFIAHEPITGKLTIVNRAGRDLILGNTNGRSWLDYSIHDSRGNLISPISTSRGARPVVIASGQAHAMRIVVNDIYPMGQVGTYRVKASVSFPQINTAFSSQQLTVQIAEGKPFWNQVVGVPTGYSGAGTYRVFELMTYFYGARQKALYFRLKDNGTNRVRRTFSLGDYLAVRPPKYAIDRNNQLHVVHMTAPQQYYYTVIDLNGEVVVREKYFEHKNSRPTLVTLSTGDIELRGGITEEQAKTPYEKREFRRLSERPPNMPRL